MTQPFGDADNGTGEKFKFSVFIVLHNRMISALVAIFAIIIRKSSFKPVAPAYAYLGVSASNVVATSCQVIYFAIYIYVQETGWYCISYDIETMIQKSS